MTKGGIIRLVLVGALVFLACPGRVCALQPNEWRFRQTLEVTQRGLVRLNVPRETFNASRPNMEDVRIIDPSGREVPFVVDRLLPQAESSVAPREFRVSISGSVTQINVVTGRNAFFRAISLEAPGGSPFIKPVRVEGSHDGKEWKKLADHEPIFRMAGGASNLRVAFPDGGWEFLRLAVDDTRSAPVPFTGVTLQTGAQSAPAESMKVTVKSRDENPGMTRLSLDLGGTNLTPANVHIETPDPLFSRVVTVAVPEILGENIAEQPVTRSVIYKIDVGGKSESRLDVPIDRQIHGRELLLLIENGDSPSLSITGVRMERRTAALLFPAEQPGRYLLLTGNSQCAAANYDLSGLATDLKTRPGQSVAPAIIVQNPDYKVADALAHVSLAGARLDTAPWAFRKSLQVKNADVQQVELDLEILAHASRDLGDLRLVSNENQIPFLLEKTSISRAVTITPSAAGDPDRPSVSRWSLKLPKAGLPITRMVATPGPGVFQREFRLSEIVSGGPGEDFTAALATAHWTQTPDEKKHEIVFTLTTPPRTDSLFLETDNGDNPGVQLGEFRAFVPVTRVIFKATADGAPVWLYYGNHKASAPHYDLNLVAQELLRSEKAMTAIGSEEVLKARVSTAGEALTGSSRYVFWGVMGMVVIGLLMILARFVPKTE